MAEEHAALLIIFGGSGDLAHRKLYPALFHLFKKGSLRQHFAVIGTARRDWSNDHFRSTIAEFLPDDGEDYTEFLSHFYYQAHDVTDSQHYQTLKELGERLDQRYETGHNRIFYMAMAPSLFGTIATHLKDQHLFTKQGYNRLIIEKPFGHDYDSALELNQQLEDTFDADQIFRIDHYLGKEVLRSLMQLRFGNPWVNHIWNRDMIDHFQITLAEELGVEARGGYYETAGALRDMVQNHIMQVIALLACPQPQTFSDKDVNAAKAEVFSHLKKLTAEEISTHFIRGQYGKNTEQKQLAYRDERNIAADSTTETFVAGKVELTLADWVGVPFYIRTGKRLAAKQTRLDVVFKPQTAGMMAHQGENSVLTLIVEPNSQLIWQLNGKQVGDSEALVPIKLGYHYSSTALAQIPDAYEYLIQQAMDGHQRHFAQWDGMACSWRYIDAIKAAWQEHTPDTFPNYVSGSLGPKAAETLLRQDGRDWIWQEEQD